MKKVITISLFVLIAAFGANAQELLAEYPLYQNGKDVTGNNTDMTIINAPFQYEAIYSNGIYNGTDPSGSLIQTPLISDFNFDNFSLSLNFMIEDLDVAMPIIVGGAGHSWIGAVFEFNKIGLLINDSLVEMTDFEPEANTWYYLGLSYNKAEGYAYLHLNGYLLKSYAVEELYHDNESSFLNAHSHGELAYKGYWRFLKIFNSSEAAGVLNPSLEDDIAINSKKNRIIVDVSNNYNGITMNIFDLSGKVVGTYEMANGNNEIAYPSNSNIVIASFISKDGRVFNRKITR